MVRWLPITDWRTQPQVLLRERRGPRWIPSGWERPEDQHRPSPDSSILFQQSIYRLLGKEISRSVREYTTKQDFRDAGNQDSHTERCER